MSLLFLFIFSALVGYPRPPRGGCHYGRIGRRGGKAARLSVMYKQFCRIAVALWFWLRTPYRAPLRVAVSSLTSRLCARRDGLYKCHPRRWLCTICFTSRFVLSAFASVSVWHSPLGQYQPPHLRASCIPTPLGAALSRKRTAVCSFRQSSRGRHIHASRT